MGSRLLAAARALALVALCGLAALSAALVFLAARFVGHSPLRTRVLATAGLLGALCLWRAIAGALAFRRRARGLDADEPQGRAALADVLIAAAAAGPLFGAISPVGYRMSGLSVRAQTRGSLESVRGGLSMAYSDLEGRYPADAAELTSRLASHEMQAPELWRAPEGLEPHPATREIRVFSSRKAVDGGTWAYVGGGAESGEFFIDCTHTDASGARWDSY